MKKILTLLCLVTTVIFSSITKVEASHAVGADLTYTLVSQVPYVIHLKLRFYRDCSGIPAPTTGNIDISSASCGMPTFTVNMPLVSTIEIVTSDCIDTSAQTTCNPGGTRYGVEEYIYETDVTLPSACADWKFEFEECCRNTNQTMTGNPYMYVSTTTDNLNYPGNSSPQFLSYPATSFCVGNPFYYKQEATDPDGDSLVYSLVDAQTNGGAFVNYIFPYSGTYPIASSSGVTIDQTGQIYLTPSVLQIAVICVLVEEFRNGVKIGEVKRDIQVKVEVLCDPNLIPKYNVLALTGGITVPCGTFAFDIPFKRDVQCGSIVNDDFRVINSLGLPIPIDSIRGYNCFGGLTDSIRVYLSEPFTYGDNYLWTKTGSDGNTILGKCGFGSTTYDTLKYIVNDSTPWVRSTDSIGCTINSFTTTLTEYVYCYTVDQNASSVQLVDAGNGNAILPIVSTYTYCGPSGDSLSNQLLINFTSQQTPAGPIYLIAKTGSDGNTIANSCGRFLTSGDTMAVFYINNNIPLSLGNDIDACANNEVPVVLNSGLTAGTLTFQWYLNGAPISGATNPTYSASATGIYGVVASATAFCRGSDSVDINVINVPVINFGSDRDICQGDSVNLVLPPNAIAYQWFINGIGNTVDSFPNYTINSTGQFVGLYVGSNLAQTHLCFSTDTIVVTAHPYPTATLSNQTVCSNTLPYSINAGNPGATYLWNTGATSPTINVSPVAGTSSYSVTITNFPSCTVEDSMQLTVLQSPSATLPATVTRCANVALPILDPGFIGAISYSWTDQNNLQVATSQTFTPPATIGTNTYTVLVSNGTCTASAQSVVTVNAIPVINATIADTIICELDPATSLSANYTGSNVTYLWSTGSVTQSINANVANTYTVTVTENGCSAQDAVTLAVQAQLAAPILTCGAGASNAYKIVYTWTDIPGNTGYEVSADGGIWVDPTNVTGPTSHGTNTITPNFFVRTKMGGPCTYGKESLPVACGVVIPSIVTPNGDGQNDLFLIDNIGFYPDNTFKIFNRWGKEVFSEGGYNNTTKVFSGKDLPEGTYFYILDLGNGADPASGTLRVSK